MPNIIVEDGKWLVRKEIDAAGTVRNTLQTQNHFLDKDIVIETITPEGALGAGTGSVEATDSVGLLGTAAATAPASGPYVKVSGEANVAVATEGYLEEGVNVDAPIADVYYPIAEGTQAVTGGALSAGNGTTALASDGLSDGTAVDATKKIVLSETNAAGYYELEASGKGLVNRAAINKQQTAAGYMAADAAPVEQIAADSLESNEAKKKYYVKQSTLSATEVTSSNVDQTVTIGDGYHHEVRTVTVKAMEEVTPTTSIANTGMSTYFDPATQASHEVAITPQYSNAAGYVPAHTDQNNGGVEYYDIKKTEITKTDASASGTSATLATASVGTGWIEAETINSATFANSATAGKTYVDISDTTAAPVLVAGDALYINAGYTGDMKISLSKLVPDGSDVGTHDDYILSGHSAYNNDGVLVAGSIPTYQGAYIVG